jgi:hypothetical protein
MGQNGTRTARIGRNLERGMAHSVHPSTSALSALDSLFSASNLTNAFPYTGRAKPFGTIKESASEYQPANKRALGGSGPHVESSHDPRR